MAREDSVVTPERYAQGFNYPDYMDQIKVNKARFEGFYDGLTLSAEDVSFFKELSQRPNGPAKMMVIGEDWCGDVVRGLPVLARVAEAAGIPISIFPRDSHMDIMNEYLNRGEFLSIPVAVFYTTDHKYICHWIERPAIAIKETGEIEKGIRDENPTIEERE
ncbi:MAG: thioredoxin family protein, partial [Chloroflexota bacterium]|nr:thioredoxin family protein [Chloroflexota bacterium]